MHKIFDWFVQWMECSFVIVNSWLLLLLALLLLIFFSQSLYCHLTIFHLEHLYIKICCHCICYRSDIRYLNLKMLKIKWLCVEMRVSSECSRKLKLHYMNFMFWKVLRKKKLFMRIQWKIYYYNENRKSNAKTNKISQTAFRYSLILKPFSHIYLYFSFHIHNLVDVNCEGNGC